MSAGKVLYVKLVSVLVSVLFLAACTSGQSSETRDAEDLFDYQIGGAYEPDPRVTAVIRDREDEPLEGKWSGCYVNAFQSQPGANTPEDLLLHDDDGKRIEDENWPGEFLFDVSNRKRDRVVELVNQWTDECAEKGFDGVEFDNLDSYTRSDGLLTQDDARATARMLIDYAHNKGLTVGQKNAVELLEPKLDFDFAVTEDCGVFDECNAFADAFPRVFAIEYTRNGMDRACENRHEKISVVLRDLELSTPEDSGYVASWCD